MVANNIFFLFKTEFHKSSGLNLFNIFYAALEFANLINRKIMV